MNRQKGAGNQRRAAERGWRKTSRLRAEHHDTQQGKGNLRECLQRGADRYGRGSLFHGQTAQCQVPGHDYGTADLPGGQQTVGRFAHPASQQ